MDIKELLHRAYYIIKGFSDTDTSNEIILEIMTITLFSEKRDIVNVINIEREEEFYSFLENINIRKKDIYFNALGSLERRKIPLKIIVELLRMFSEVEDRYLLECVDYVYAEMSSKKMKEFYLSSVPWINSLVIAIFKQNKGNIMFNAECGTGLFIEQAYNNNIAKEYIGYSANSDVVDIAAYRAELDGIKKITVKTDKFLYEDANWMADMIYLTYPLGLKQIYQDPYVSARWDKLVVKYGIIDRRKPSFNMLCILNALDNLSNNGTLIALVLNGGLFNINDRRIREYIVEYDYLDTIISLPSGIIPGIGVGCSLIILKKERLDNRKIKMINTTEWVTKQRRHSEFSNDNIVDIMNAYISGEENEQVKLVSKDEIREADYNLNFENFGVYEPLINPVKLKNVSEDIFRGYQIKASELDEIVTSDAENTNYRIISVADIQQEGYIADNLQAVNIENKRKFSKYCLEDGDLIITAKNTSVKTAIYHKQPGINTILSGNLICIRLNQEKCNPYYLLAFLKSESGGIGLNRAQRGTVMKVISPAQLEEMTISLLEPEQQNIIAANYKDTVQEIKELQKRINKKLNSMKSIYDIFR